MENVSLVCLGRQVLYDRSLKSMDDALEYFKLSGHEFGFANLDELRKKHSESSSSDLKYVIELITGSETLVVVDPSDIYRLTTRNRNTHDNLLNLPQDFRAALKGRKIAANLGNEGLCQMLQILIHMKMVWKTYTDFWVLPRTPWTTQQLKALNLVCAEEDLKMFDGKDSIPLLNQ
ncbi:hypothetical protein OESDEN_12331 [Oesophagostomum dentatum]|uniref:Uncharacterized protein n=1 Tax=Oesophagostomum dentatum TaxID=61180 RepID=A0A0B1SXF2_OESDE|nr:hypothetical protein OESDEN_12331 [Oesophagostomum dentatum]